MVFLRLLGLGYKFDGDHLGDLIVWTFFISDSWLWDKRLMNIWTKYKVNAKELLNSAFCNLYLK